MSALDTNIISAARVKALTGKAQGVEDRKLDHSIHDAQDALEQILGTTLYALVEAAHPTFAGDYVTLYTQYIEPFLAFKTIELSFENLFAEPDRNGVFKKQGQEYVSVTMKELAMLQAKPASRADRFQQKMIKWLKDLDSTNAIRIAYDTDVKCEPRTTRTDSARVSLRRSPWQNQGGYRHHHHGPNCHCDEH